MTRAWNERSQKSGQWPLFFVRGAAMGEPLSTSMAAFIILLTRPVMIAVVQRYYRRKKK